jgi:siroheme synthase-like protein
MVGLPVELNLGGRKVLVVGLGSVGKRKAAHALAAGAHVVGVDPALADRDLWPEGVEVLVEPYRLGHIDLAALVFASATPEVNQRVVFDAKAQGVWVNSASEPGSGNVALPAVWRDGPLTLTVSTSGASPALAAMLRDRAALALGPSASGLARLLAELRPMVFAHVSDPEERRRILEDSAHPRWLELWATQGPDAVRQRLVEAMTDDR